MLAAEGWEVAGTARSAAKTRELEADGVAAVNWSEAALGSHAFDGTTAVLISTPPEEDGCPAFAAAETALSGAANEISWIGYLSSNGVYGDHGGAWVDEASPVNAASPRSKSRLAAEAAWTALCAALGIPLVVFRLPGIYGPGRSAFDALRQGRARRIVKPGQVFNRMHVDDIAAALGASLAHPFAGRLFNLADDEPAPPEDVIEYAARLLGVEPPPLVSIEAASLTEMARSFYSDNKRVSNALMKEKLAVALRYPTYREGLRAILQEGNGVRANHTQG